jgi:hypothetical protein
LSGKTTPLIPLIVKVVELLSPTFKLPETSESIRLIRESGEFSTGIVIVSTCSFPNSILQVAFPALAPFQLAIT